MGVGMGTMKKSVGQGRGSGSRVPVYKTQLRLSDRVDGASIVLVRIGGHFQSHFTSLWQSSSVTVACNDSKVKTRSGGQGHTRSCHISLSSVFSGSSAGGWGLDVGRGPKGLDVLLLPLPVDTDPEVNGAPISVTLGHGLGVIHRLVGVPPLLGVTSTSTGGRSMLG